MRGLAEENAAIDDAGKENNHYATDRAGNPRTPVIYTAAIDGQTVTVRPDAVSDTVWADIKSLSGETDVHHFTRQLRAEFNGALSEGKKLIVVLSSASPEVRPSKSFTSDGVVSEGVTVLRRDPGTGDWFAWSAEGQRRCEPLPLEDVQALAGSGEVQPHLLGREGA